jgi:hypothetical protein
VSERERELAEQLANAERDGERFCHRIAELEAIVGNCDRTRDGAIIQPRMILYAKTYGGRIRDVQAVMLVKNYEGCYVAAASCYSTRAAAEGAKT